MSSLSETVNGFHRERIDFAPIRDASLNRSLSLLQKWLPDGQREGKEWVARNPLRADGRAGSFKINIDSGEWADFATGDKGGDLIALRAYLDSSNQLDAARRLAEELGIEAGQAEGLTLGRYAEAKKLPTEFLRGLGLENIPDPWGKRRSVLAFSYRKPDGELFRKRIRVALAKPVDGSPRMLWDKREEKLGASLYGLDVLPAKGCQLLIVEGESDAQTLWYHGFDAVGCPGANGYAVKRDDPLLAGYDLLAVMEPDEGGKALIRQLSKSKHRKRIRIIQLEGCKDINELHCKAGYQFEETLEAAIAKAEPLDKLLKREPELDAKAEPTRVKLPRGFRYGLDGSIETMSSDKDENDEVEWRRLCSPVELLAETRDVEGTSWGLLLRVKTREGVWHERAFSRAMTLTQGDEFLASLANLGLRFDDSSAVRKRIKLLFSRFETDVLARVADHVGWHGEGLFVLPDEAFGTEGGDMVVFSPDRPVAHNYRLSGTAEGWRTEVAARVSGNSRLVFALSAAFAGPLLNLLKMEGGGFHYRGGSSIGKTSTLFAAGSVWGGNDNADIGFAYSWRGTDNGIESKAVGHSDTLLMLDEIHQVHGEVASKIVYTLANGQGKARASRQGGARNSPEWRVLFLSTGEVGLGTKLAEAGLKTMAGQETRFVELEADAEAGHGTFENLHGCRNGAAFSKELKAACKTHYGHAARAFLHGLMANREAHREELSRFLTEFAARLCPAGADGQVYRAAERFALVAAAGRLATQMGVLPWQANEAEKAARRLFNEWLERRGSAGALEGRKALEQVRAVIEQHGSARFVPWEAPGTPVINRLGFVRRDLLDETRTTYYILPQMFRNEVCKGLEMPRVIKELVRIGALTPDKRGKSASLVRVPGVGVSRCYVIDAARLFADDPSDEDPGAETR